MKNIFIWCWHSLDQEKIDKFILHNPYCKDFVFKQIPKDILMNNIFDFLIDNNASALLHKNEHGFLHCTKDWINLTNECLKNKIPVLSFDFGYFDHYESFMVDYYLPDCKSSIYNEWYEIPELVCENEMPIYIKNHFENVLGKVDFYKNQKPPLNLKNFVVIWGQWSTDLIKERFFLRKEDKKIIMSEWLENLVDLVKQEGFEPVIKSSPVKNLQHYEKIQNKAHVFVDRKNHLEELPKSFYLNDINYQLMAHGKYHIINCSSVSNELFINKCNVIAMGKSWFNDLGVFYEPKSWIDIFNYQNQLDVNKNKWLNWWTKRQCKLSELREKIVELINSIIQS